MPFFIPLAYIWSWYVVLVFILPMCIYIFANVHMERAWRWEKKPDAAIKEHKKICSINHWSSKINKKMLHTFSFSKVWLLCSKRKCYTPFSSWIFLNRICFANVHKRSLMPLLNIGMIEVIVFWHTESSGKFWNIKN